MKLNLLPATIIPPEYYVERSADRQLKQIIDGMGRPGYILVARQMGKTNLLLHARQLLENSDLLFVYIDLSNRVESLEAYFALALNTAFSVHPKLFETSNLKDMARGSYSSFEFEAALRTILSNYPGRIVFVLDEIDSLANYGFSDRIFSQIRSMYFSRANFPEYLRLTYILSGVAEPSDLIKDKNVSPFNIGEKIYLNDFTKSEFDLFLIKAAIELEQNTSDRVYHWTQGNPRMTWDVCSEVEVYIGQGGQQPTSAHIDEIVERLYLTGFDRAPVDHIRTLARSDREIRSALRALRSHGTIEVSDKARNKLYLAGITSSLAIGSAPFSIKNPIIAEALSDRWLEDIAKESNELLTQARESIDEKLYGPAVEYYEKYLLDHDIDLSKDGYRLAIAYFSTRKYAKSIEWFKAYLSSSPQPSEIRASTHLLLARAYLVVGGYNDANENLREAISKGSRSTSASARALLGSMLLQMDKTKHVDEAERLSLDVLAERAAGDDEGHADSQVIALINLATIEESRDNREAAIGLLESASSGKSISYRPLLLLRQIKLLPSGEKKEVLLNELTDSIVAVESIPAEERMDGALRQIALPAMMYLGLNGRHVDFERLLSYVIESGEYESIELPKLLDSLYSLATEYAEPGGGIFLREIVTRFSSNQSARKDVLSALRNLILEEDFSFVDRYLSFLDQPGGTESILGADLLALGFVLSHDSQRQFSRLPEFDRVASSARERTTDRGVMYAFFSYYDMIRLEDLGRSEEALGIARELLALLTEGKDALAAWNVENRSVVERAAKAVIQRHSSARPVRNENRSFGRNAKVKVLYKDGRELEAKYKFVQRDLALGLCRIVASSK